MLYFSTYFNRPSSPAYVLRLDQGNFHCFLKEFSLENFQEGHWKTASEHRCHAGFGQSPEGSACLLWTVQYIRKIIPQPHFACPPRQTPPQ